MSQRIKERPQTDTPQANSAENRGNNKRGVRQRLNNVAYHGFLAVVLAAVTSPLWINGVWKKPDAKEAYAKDFKPAAERIGRWAIKQSQGENAILQRTARDRFRRTVISATIPNRYGSEAVVRVAMGQSNGKPDPRKVTNIFLQQPQGGGEKTNVKTISITAPNVDPSASGHAWSGQEEEFTAIRGSQVGNRRVIEETLSPDQYPERTSNLASFNSFDYGEELGKAEKIADEAERMALQIQTAIRHKPGHN